MLKSSKLWSTTRMLTRLSTLSVLDLQSDLSRPWRRRERQLKKSTELPRETATRRSTKKSWRNTLLTPKRRRNKCSLLKRNKNKCDLQKKKRQMKIWQSKKSKRRRSRSRETSISWNLLASARWMKILNSAPKSKKNQSQLLLNRKRKLSKLNL